MSHFPVAWDDGTDGQAIPSGACPYATHEIEQYLRGCHYHLALHEAPSGFVVTGPVLSRCEVGTNHWLFEATDDLGRQWFVVIGSGTGPFNPGKKRRWMYADANELDQTPEAYMNDARAAELARPTLR